MLRTFAKILALAAMVVMSINAKAQSVVNTVSVSDFNACKQYLSEHPTDTVVGMQKVVVDDPAKFTSQGVVAGDTLVETTKIFLLDGRVKRQKVYTKSVIVAGVPQTVVDAELSAKVDSLTALMQAALKLDAGRPQDVKYYDASKYALLTSGQIPVKWANNWGWGFAGEAGYRAGKDINAFTFAAGPTLSWNWGRADLMFRYARSIYSRNAQHEGENYDTFGGRIGGYIKVWSFDDYKTWNLYLGGGLGFDFFKTDSKERETKSLLQSNGSEAYGFANVMLTKRFFATGNEMYLKAGWEQNPLIIQNSSTDHIDCWTVTLGWNFGINRHHGGSTTVVKNLK